MDPRDESTPIECPPNEPRDSQAGEKEHKLTAPDVSWLIASMLMPTKENPEPPWVISMISPFATETFQMADQMTSGVKWGAIVVVLALHRWDRQDESEPRIIPARIWNRKNFDPEVEHPLSVAPRFDELEGAVLKLLKKQPKKEGTRDASAQAKG